MQILKRTVLVLCAVVFCAALASTTSANEWNKRTIVTFGNAVEIPGKVLPPGTYIFKLAPSNADRHIVQIWNEDGTQLLATTMAVPEVRDESASRPVFDLEGRAGKSPLMLKSWFYQGDIEGQEFIYSENSDGR